MQPLSAADAISPAWRYARQYLDAQPRTMIAIKICAVALFSEMGSGSSLNSGIRNSSLGAAAAPVTHPALIAVLLAVILVVLLAFFYISRRLQFVLFELVLRRDTVVAPIWKRYGVETRRWIALQLLALVVCLFAVAAVAAPFVFYFVWHDGHELGVTTPFLIALVTAGIAALSGLLACTAVSVSLGSFAVPIMAFESATIAATLRGIWSLFRAHPGAMLLFALLRCLLGIGCALGANLLLIVGGAVVVIPFGIVGSVAWHFLYGGGLPSEIVLGTVLAILGLVFVVAFFLADIRLLGHVRVFLQAYTLFFMVGRYPQVDPYLEPFLPDYFVQRPFTPQPYPPPA